MSQVQRVRFLLVLWFCLALLLLLEESMTSEPEFQAHVACVVCGELGHHKDMRIIDDLHVCSEKCRGVYYRHTRPGFYRDADALYDRG